MPPPSSAAENLLCGPVLINCQLIKASSISDVLSHSATTSTITNNWQLLSVALQCPRATLAQSGSSVINFRRHWHEYSSSAWFIDIINNSSLVISILAVNCCQLTKYVEQTAKCRSRVTKTHVVLQQCRCPSAWPFPRGLTFPPTQPHHHHCHHRHQRIVQSAPTNHFDLSPVSIQSIRLSGSFTGDQADYCTVSLDPILTLSTCGIVFLSFVIH